MIEEVKNLQVLKTLALEGAISVPVQITYTQLANLLGTSQQTASKMLLKLEKLDYIWRERRSNSQYVLITEMGRGALKKEYRSYRQLIANSSRIEVKGKVITGVGEGKYYVSQYKSKFEEVCKFSPYFGTLNIKVEERELEKLEILKNAKDLELKGFKKKGHSFGLVRCFKAKVRNVPCWVVIPARTRYENVLEIASQHYLRNKLKITDGQEVKVLIEIA
ncbi:MAG TPA: DUF120 domain-containing protein [Thermoplasmata archaeon]|nr:DUF120 domain-containing protein [Thermoplasmata archaeon]HIH97917.1 DUF120 domain-containing protein [Thermoplasmata archaeon]